MPVANIGDSYYICCDPHPDRSTTTHTDSTNLLTLHDDDTEYPIYFLHQKNNTSNDVNTISIFTTLLA
jgi:hypothetical protein